MLQNFPRNIYIYIYIYCCENLVTSFNSFVICSQYINKKSRMIKTKG